MIRILKTKNREDCGLMNKIIVTGCKGQLGIAINKLYEGNREIELVNTDVEAVCNY